MNLTGLQAWVQQAPADDFWWLPCILLFAFGISGWKGFRYLMKRRIIEDLPLSRLRSAAQGYVALAGTCELMEGTPIVAPLTARHCAWHEFAVEEYRKHGRNGRWHTIRSGRSSELFLLIDTTGQCVIDPDGAHVTCIHKDRWYGSNHDGRPRTTGSSWSIFGRRYRFTEKRLHVGDPLYALGLFRTVGGAGTGLCEATAIRSLLAEWKQDTATLLEKFDKNRDGEICLEEWEAVRTVAWDEVRKQHAELQTAPPVNTLGETRDLRRPFLLSALPQFDLTRKLGYYSSGLLLLALLTGLGGSWLLVARLTMG
ncbi:MAG: GIDE domain-containing protein [Gammaproteobacteria bacterium]